MDEEFETIKEKVLKLESLLNEIINKPAPEPVKMPLGKEGTYQLIFEQANEGVVLLDFKEKIIKVNPKFLSMTGSTQGEVIGQKLSEFIPKFAINNELIISSYETSFKEGKADYELKLKGPTKELTVLLRPSVIKEPNGEKRLLVIISDLTDYNKMKNLQLEIESNKKLNELRNNLIVTITHDLKQPLMPIIGFADLVKEKITDDKLLNYLNSVISSAEVMLVMINKLLTLFKLDSGLLEFNKKKISIENLIDECIKTQENNIVLKKLSIIKNIPKIIINCDPIQLKEALSNLINNAIKFSKEGGKIELTAKQLENNALISIKDYGLGIKTEDITCLFKGFYQTAEGKKIGGTGIGLSIVKKIINNHNGSIEVKSDYGKGTEFIIRIPL